MKFDIIFYLLNTIIEEIYNLTYKKFVNKDKDFMNLSKVLYCEFTWYKQK